MTTATGHASRHDSARRRPRQVTLGCCTSDEAAARVVAELAAKDIGTDLTEIVGTHLRMGAASALRPHVARGVVVPGQYDVLITLSHADEARAARHLSDPALTVHATKGRHTGAPDVERPGHRFGWSYAVAPTGVRLESWAKTSCVGETRRRCR